MDIRSEVEALASAQGAETEWDHDGWVRVLNPKNGKWTIFSPPDLMRVALLPSDHPDSTKLRPGGI